MSNKLFSASLLGAVALGFPSQDVTVNRYATSPEQAPYMVFINPVFRENSRLTYNSAKIENRGGAFTFVYTNGDGKDDGFDGYPSAKIGGVLRGGKYHSNQEYSNITGLPVQIKDLSHNLRIQWRTSQKNADRPDSKEKWFASINVIFDSASDPNSRPIPEDRDFDLVILRESNNYSSADLKDRPRYDRNGEANGRYWFFGRKPDGSLQRLSLERNGQSYDYAVRYKFHNYGADRAAKDIEQNNKVHVKFFPLSKSTDSILPNHEIEPFNHALKAFVDATKDNFQYVESKLTQAEIDLAEEKLAVDDLWIKSVSAGYEVYRTNPQRNLVLRNNRFNIVLE